jgi:hypothetical protein
MHAESQLYFTKEIASLVPEAAQHVVKRASPTIPVPPSFKEIEVWLCAGTLRCRRVSQNFPRMRQGAGYGNRRVLAEPPEPVRQADAPTGAVSCEEDPNLLRRNQRPRSVLLAGQGAKRGAGRSMPRRAVMRVVGANDSYWPCCARKLLRGGRMGTCVIAMRVAGAVARQRLFDRVRQRLDK